MLDDAEAELVGEPADGEMLGEGCEGAEEEVEDVLEEDGEVGDGGGGGERGGEAFDVCPGQVDVEEKKEGTETEDGGLGGGVSTVFGELEKGMYV
jgi:hypothetical protein